MANYRQSIHIISNLYISIRQILTPLQKFRFMVYEFQGQKKLLANAWPHRLTTGYSLMFSNKLVCSRQVAIFQFLGAAREWHHHFFAPVVRKWMPLEH